MLKEYFLPGALYLKSTFSWSSMLKEYFFPGALCLASTFPLSSMCLKSTFLFFWSSILKEHFFPGALCLKSQFKCASIGRDYSPALLYVPSLKLELQHFNPEATLRTHPAASLLQNDQDVLSGASFHHGFESLPK